jgi:hypothetical protein
VRRLLGVAPRRRRGVLAHAGGLGVAEAASALGDAGRAARRVVRAPASRRAGSAASPAIVASRCAAMTRDVVLIVRAPVRAWIIVATSKTRWRWANTIHQKAAMTSHCVHQPRAPIPSRRCSASSTTPSSAGLAQRIGSDTHSGGAPRRGGSAVRRVPATSPVALATVEPRGKQLVTRSEIAGERQHRRPPNHLQDAQAGVEASQGAQRR